MHGDFSRLTFDPNKHYRSVRLQQGRPQLDADWNEQMDILNHYLDTQFNDVLGSSGAPAAQAGFAITLEEDAVEAEQELTRDQDSLDEQEVKPPDFWIGAGHYYVDGVLCENDATVRFTDQPHYPGAVRLAHKARAYLAYLDVWQRGVTVHDDSSLREIALGGLDTTTRAQTVWQVKLLPIHNADIRDRDERLPENGVDLPEWQSLINRYSDRARLTAQRQPAATVPENQQYRVEIHQTHSQAATFKWSRENGSVVFELDAIQSIHDQTEATQLVVRLKDLGRDRTQLQQGDWVEWLDAEHSFDGQSGPLYQVSVPPDYTRQQITLQGKSNHAIATQTQSSSKHVLLRRWDQRGSAAVELVGGAIPIEPDTWLDLEAGIQIRFSAGTLHAGDYWLIPARAATSDVEWPRLNNQPIARLPDGNQHHFSPLAYLYLHDRQWRIAQDMRLIFESIPTLSRKSEHALRQIERLQTMLQRFETAVANETREEEVREKQVFMKPAHLTEDFAAQCDLEIGDVVSLNPERGQVEKTSEGNETLVIGTVAERIPPAERKSDREVRVVLYGRARCQVVGPIEPGDILVPSDRPGYACKGGVYLRPGTVIGKALSGHRPADVHDTGLIDSLVTIR